MWPARNLRQKALRFRARYARRGARAGARSRILPAGRGRRRRDTGREPESGARRTGRQRLLLRLLSLYPPFLGAGIRVRIAPDRRTFEVRMVLGKALVETLVEKDPGR
jgi:hypothetical protein